MKHPSLGHDDIARLRDALASAGYTVDAVRDVLGPIAAAALDRNETTPGRLATTGDSVLETLTRLWPLQLPVPLAAAKEAVPVEPLIAGGILTHDGTEVRAVVDVRPYADDAGDWWVVSDLTPGLDGVIEPVPDDHVLGLNAASSTLAQLTVRRPVGTALDLGTGCGVQALHLSRHVDRVVATDLSHRALALAGLTMGLNGLDVELRHGSLYQPVSAQRFDLIATNPPFVVSPGGHHVYRDGGLSGDELSRQVVRDGAAHLAEGGILQALANWVHVRGEDWQGRVASWVADTGCDAWVIQREVQDPAAYVELWLRDSGDVARPDYVERYEAWLSWFDAQRIEGIAFGWVMLRATGSADPDIRIEDWPYPVEQPLGPAIGDYFDRIAALRGLTSDDALLATRLLCADDVVQEQIGEPGADDPEHLVLRQGRGVRRAVPAGTAEAGFVGACDGSLTSGALIAALASVLDVDADRLQAELLPWIRERVAEGFLLPAETE